MLLECFLKLVRNNERDEVDFARFNEFHLNSTQEIKSKKVRKLGETEK